MDKMNEKFALAIASLKISCISRRPIKETDFTALFYLEKDGFPVLERLKDDKDELLIEMYKLVASDEEKVWALCQAFNARLSFLSLFIDEQHCSFPEIQRMRRSALSIFQKSCEHVVMREQLTKNPDFFRESDLAYFKAANTRRKLNSESSLRCL